VSVHVEIEARVIEEIEEMQKDRGDRRDVDG
jgi:hypothetical protein